MSERAIYRHDAPEPPLRAEWVKLAKGEVCVRELRFAESLNIIERSQRHGKDPRGQGADVTQLRVLQIMMSCYYGEEEDARRVFADADFARIHQLRNWESDAILQAINRVNGEDPAQQEEQRDFLPVTAAPANS